MDASIKGIISQEGTFTREGGGAQAFVDRAQTQEEIFQLIKQLFGNKEKLDFQQFVKINLEQSSEMFLAILILLQTSIPCSENFNRYKAKYCQFLKSDVDE